MWIPDPEDEAIRDLSRAREDAVNSRVQARHQLKGFLLRHDVRYTGKTSWCGAYYRWLATLNFGAGAAQTAFTEYWQAVTAADDRVDRLPSPPPQSASAVDAVAAESIHLEFKRGALGVSVTWPVSAAADCAAWLREVSR